MERSLYSPNWHRVKDLRPQLRAHVGVHRQRYRGQLWYILQDRTSGRFHRFTPSAQYIISLMDGNHTVQEIWDQAGIALGEDVLTQDEMIRLLAQLHTSDVLFGDIPPDVAELHERGERLRKRKRFAMFMNPLAIRFPLFDPDKFLEALMPFIRPIFSAIGALILFGIVGCAFVLAGMYWDELTEDITNRVLATESLLLLLVTYPLVKTVHELGHGFAVKRWGGEVHEIGVMLLVFMPVPYVDASAASVYPEHWRRAIVGAAGIIVELLLASFALFGWISAEEGVGSIIDSQRSFTNANSA